MIDERELIVALEPLIETVSRLLTIVETVTARLDCLELEVLHLRQPAPDPESLTTASPDRVGA